ncbi:hypothetical protein LEMLEM_LOCUS14569 [Lemmus lemmus]
MQAAAEGSRRKGTHQLVDAGCSGRLYDQGQQGEKRVEKVEGRCAEGPVGGAREGCLLLA